MEKIKSVKHDKIWGYEIWLYSPVKGMETTFENGQINKEGPLIKIIKANMPLSVQVHPDDKWAQKLEKMNNGKSESWMVLDAEPKAELIVGINHMTPNQIREKLKNKTFNKELIRINPSVGDFINIPAGLVHGIGAGMTVFEVQQPSDITYRYYDYDRLQNGKPRELHIEKAIKVQKDLKWNLKPESLEPLVFVTKAAKQIFSTKPIVVQNKSIVVDLNSYDTFVAQPGTKVNFLYFAIIEM